MRPLPLVPPLPTGKPLITLRTATRKGLFVVALPVQPRCTSRSCRAAWRKRCRSCHTFSAGTRAASADSSSALLLLLLPLLLLLLFLLLLLLLLVVF